MSDWKITEPQLLALNAELQRTDDVLIHNCLTRTAQESKLFPIMPYLMMCFYDAYYRFPDLLRKATEHVTPEDMMKEALANISRYKPEPSFAKTGVGYLRTATPEEREAEMARSDARIKRAKARAAAAKRAKRR